jgi:hypothetical protein
MKYVFAFIAGLVLVSCAGVSKNELTRAKSIACTKEQFAAQPFGFELTVENIEKYYKPLLRREHYLVNEQPEEVFRFFKGQTELLFVKPYNSPLEAMSGNIHTSKIKLMNDICVGMSRKEFFWKFSDWQYDEADMLVIQSSATGCSFHFVFSKDKLRSVKIVNRRKQLRMWHQNRISGSDSLQEPTEIGINR